MLIAPIGVGGDLPYVKWGRIVGIDVSFEGLSSLKGRQAEGVLGDISRLPFADRVFRVVLSPLFFHHYVDFGFEPFLLEMYRVLMSNGCMVILEPSSLHPLSILAATIKKRVGNLTGAVEDERPFPPRMLLGALRRCGFEQPRLYGASFTHNRVPVPIARILNVLTKPLLDVPVAKELAWMCLFFAKKPTREGRM